MGKPKTKICETCNRELRLTNFEETHKGSGVYLKVCRVCRNTKRNEAYDSPVQEYIRRITEHWETWPDGWCPPKTVHRRNKTELPDGSAGYVADHVSSQVGRRIIIRPKKTSHNMYDSKKSPYNARALAQSGVRYELGEKMENDHIEWQDGKWKLVKGRRRKGCWVRPRLTGRMVASKSGNVKYLGNGWYETEAGGRGIGEALDDDDIVIEHAQHFAVPGHQRDKASHEAAFDYIMDKAFNYNMGHEEWKQEMINARSTHSDSLMADVLAELEAFPTNEHNEQPCLTSDSGPFGKTFDRYYNRSRPLEGAGRLGDFV
jgi:hypothetical protein